MLVAPLEIGKKKKTPWAHTTAVHVKMEDLDETLRVFKSIALWNNGRETTVSVQSSGYHL